MKRGKCKLLIICIVLIAFICCSLYVGYLIGTNSQRPVVSIPNTVTPTVTPPTTEDKNKLSDDSLVVKKKPLEQYSKNGDSRKLDSYMALSYENKIYVPLDVVSNLTKEFGEVSYYEQGKGIFLNTPLWKPFIVKPQLLEDFMLLADVEKMLGKPFSSKQEAWESDKPNVLINKYRDAEITYLRSDGVYKVYNYTLTTDKIMTDRYIKVGVTVDEVRKAYGQDIPDAWKDKPGSLYYGVKDRIIFDTKEGKVVSITVAHQYD